MCRDSGIECFRDHGRLAVLRRASVSDAPTILWEPGGPGVDSRQLIDFVPGWMKKLNVVVVPEPWAYASEPGCAPELCPAAQFTSEEYADVVASAEQHWSRIDGVVAFSFGAVRVLPLLSDTRFSGTHFWIGAPAPLPGTSGSTLARLRLAAASAAVREVMHCPTVACSKKLNHRLSAFLSGRLGVSASDAQSALMGLASSADANVPFFRSIFLNESASLAPKYALAVRRAAFTLEMRGRDAASVRQRRGYLAGVCSAYPWPDTSSTGFLRLHKDCASADAEPALPKTDARRCRCAVTLVINDSDPVVPPRLQSRWTPFLGSPTVEHYKSDDHTLPSGNAFHAFVAGLSRP